MQSEEQIGMSYNELGYKIYVWEQTGYQFIPQKYNSKKDYTAYLHYYTDPIANAKLWEKILCSQFG